MLVHGLHVSVSSYAIHFWDFLADVSSLEFNLIAQ